MGRRVFFWPFSEWVGGEGKWSFPSPFTYKKMEAMKSKASCNVPLRGTNEMQFPAASKRKPSNRLWAGSPRLLQELSIHQHTWCCCYHGDSSPFAFLDSGVETGWGTFAFSCFPLASEQAKGRRGKDSKNSLPAAWAICFSACVTRPPWVRGP